LARMLKCWQAECNVPLKPFHLELMATQFIGKWAYRGESLFWYDWMVRDCFAFLRSKANDFVLQPGTNEYIFLGSDWLPKAERAHTAAMRACEYERYNNDRSAQICWKDIFGSEIKTI